MLRAAACAALLVLALGLPRLLVLCEHGDGEARLAFRHAPGTCCDAHPGDAGATATDEGGPVLHADPRCTHRDLVVELQPAPRAGATGALDAPTVWLLPTAGPPPVPALRAVPRPPPATGPPRVDRRAALRATTVLLV